MIIVADNLQVLNPAVAAALERLDPGPIQELARRCEGAGAQLLDLNPGYLSPRREDRLAFMVEAVQEATALSLMLDSPLARVLARGLKACRDKPILNALTLEEKKLEEILPLAAANQTPLVLLLLDERSFPPPDLEGKIALALNLRERALAGGLSDDRLIFDPVLPNLSWPEVFRQTGAVIQTVRLLSSGAVFPEPARTMAGLSNLRSGLRRSYPFQVEAACLSLLAGAGLTYALADVLQPGWQDLRQLIEQMS
jgi:5-methyltetrahydrofolate corrinoid/iron sulfur protein methyltransferase